MDIACCHFMECPTTDREQCVEIQARHDGQACPSGHIAIPPEKSRMPGWIRMDYSSFIYRFLWFVWTIMSYKLFRGDFSFEYIEWINSLVHAHNFMVTVKEIAFPVARVVCIFLCKIEAVYTIHAECDGK